MNSISELKIDNKFVDITLKLDIFNQLLLQSNLQTLIQPTEILQQSNNLEISVLNETIIDLLNTINLLKQEILLKNSQNDANISKCNANIEYLKDLVEDILKESAVLNSNNQNAVVNISNLLKSLQDNNNKIINIDLNVLSLLNNITTLTSSLKSLSINLQTLRLSIDKLTIDQKDIEQALDSLKASKEMSVQAMKLAWEVSNKISKLQ